MAAELTVSAITGAFAAAGTYLLMEYIGLPVSGWWCATCASALFLVDLWRA
jgi:hypothetical protein